MKYLLILLLLIPLAGNAQFFIFLDSLNDGTGGTNFIYDYSGGDTVCIQPANIKEVLHVNRMIVSIIDANNMIASEYGNLNTALTNGIIIKVFDLDDNVLVDLTNGAAVKSNSAWAQFCYDTEIRGWGSGNELLAARWTFGKTGIPLELNYGRKFCVILEDNFTGLVEHKFNVQGYSEVHQ